MIPVGRLPLDGCLAVIAYRLRRGECDALRAWALPIQVPVPIEAHEPCPIRRCQSEPGDRALEPDLVGVQQLDRERKTLVDRSDDLGAYWIVGISQCSLPHADVAGRDIEVP